MKYYHATLPENAISITEKGLLPGFDGMVYLTKDPVDAQKFVWIRGVKKILVVTVELDESDVEESFDHNPIFFQCRAFAYKGTIEPEKVFQMTLYDYTKEEGKRV